MQVTQEPAALTQRILDEAAIRFMMERFWYGIDHRDYETFGSCFADDAVMEYHDGRDVVVGRDVLVARNARGNPDWGASNHAISNSVISVDGDRATGDTYAVAHVLVGEVNSGRMLVRGVRYVDQFTRTPEGWRIQRRRHIPLWQYEADTVVPWLPLREAPSPGSPTEKPE